MRGPVPTFDAALAADALRRCILFRRLSDDDLQLCTARLVHRRFRRGEVVFHAGDPGESLHVIVSGAVRVELPSPGGDQPAILIVLHPGEFFGELALLDGEPRSATVVAAEATETLVLERPRFQRLVDEIPSLRWSLLASITAELRRVTGRIEALLFLDLGGRLAAQIVEIARHDPAASGQRQDVRIAWPYTQAELAGMIGGSRESVNRLLGDLAARGLLRVERDSLYVPDLDLLAAEALG